MANNNIIPLEQFQGSLVLDITKGPMGTGGGAPDEGIYDVTIKFAGVSTAGRNPSLTLTLAGIGSYDEYVYLNLPTVDANGNPVEKAESYARLLAQAAIAFGADPTSVAQNFGVVPASALAQWFRVGAVGKVYYIPRITGDTKGPDGKYEELAPREHTFLTAAQVAEIEAGTLTIKRWSKVKQPGTPGNGATVAGAQLGGGAPTMGAPTLGGGAPQQAPTQQAAPTLGGGNAPQPQAAPALSAALNQHAGGGGLQAAPSLASHA